MIDRADKLTDPPIVGKYYLVPAIRWTFTSDAGQTEKQVLRFMETHESSKWWPVWGRKHNDVEFFNFHSQHYHIDPRFLTRAHWADVSNSNCTHDDLSYVQSRPLNHVGLKIGPPKPQLRRMRCSMVHSQWDHADKQPSLEINNSFEGQQCKRGLMGFMCPHKRFMLGSVVPVDGIITCPLHGLRINAETGVCVGPER